VVALRNIFGKLARPPEDVRSDNLRHWVTGIEGVTAIGDLQPRERARIAGVVQNLRIDPREGTGSIEATIIDGTGQLVVRWLGRRSLSGVRLGVGLIIEGICGGPSREGELVVLNPEYELVPDPEHG
jgi:hypothetical protein